MLYLYDLYSDLIFIHSLTLILFIIYIIILILHYLYFFSFLDYIYLDFYTFIVNDTCILIITYIYVCM